MITQVVTSYQCDPVQQKMHLVGQVYSEIMNQIVCKIKGNIDFVNVVFPIQ